MLLIWPLQWDKPEITYIDLIPQGPSTTKTLLWHHQSNFQSLLHFRLVLSLLTTLISHHCVHLLLRCVRRYETHLNRCHPCSSAISPCGRFIASGSEDNCVSCNTVCSYSVYIDSVCFTLPCIHPYSYTVSQAVRLSVSIVWRDYYDNKSFFSLGDTTYIQCLVLWIKSSDSENCWWLMWDFSIMCYCISMLG